MKKADFPTWPEGFEMESMGGSCPYQGVGEWSGRQVYFRSRGDRWSLSVDGDASKNGLGERIARGVRCNSGWLSDQEAAERIALHAWAWRALGDEEGAGGAQAKLHAAILGLDALAASEAIALGADPSAPIEPGAPTPLCLALGHGCQASAERGPREEAEPGGVDEMCDAMMAVSQDGVDAKRLGVVVALLAGGADPRAKAPGWSMAPIHWAALLPAGQRASLSGAVSDEGIAGGAMERAALRQEELEPARMGLNPMSALMEYGADISERCSWNGSGADALDLCVDTMSWGWARRLAEMQGPEALSRYARGLLASASLAWSMSEASPSRRGSWVESRAARELVASFESGSWPLEWLDAAGSEPRHAAVAMAIKARALSSMESNGIGRLVQESLAGRVLPSCIRRM